METNLRKQKCVIYVRVSADHQDYKSQITDLKKVAIAKNLVIEMIFSEKVSGFDQSVERPEYDKMKEYVLKNNISQILMWELSRLARNTLKSLQEIKYYTDKGVNIFLYKENIDTISETNKLLIAIMSTMAEIERDNIIKRLGRGHRESVSQGKRTGLMTLPYGYKADDKGFLIVDEEEAKVIKDIYKMAFHEMGYRGIARELNSKGVPTRWTKLGRINKNIYNEVVPIKWKPNSIGVILNNTLYKGKRKYKDEYFDVTPIIDESEWDKVHDVISKKPGVNNKPTKYNYLLKGKVICGVCGRHYGARTETRYGKEDSYYYCNGARDIEIRCKNGQYSSKVLEEAIHTLMFLHQDLLISLKQEEYSNFNMEDKLTQIKYYTDEINEKQEQQKRLVELRLKGHIDEKRYNKEYALILGQNEGNKIKIENLKKEIVNYNNTKSNLGKLQWNNFLADDKQPFIDKYLNKVVIHKINDVKLTEKELNDLSVKSLADNLRNQDKIQFIKRLFDTKYKHRRLFVEIYAFNNTKPLNAIIINDLFYKTKRVSPLGLYTVFIAPSLSIDAGVLK
ncbi:MAG: recombinase family protein [Bacteroidales bacterium]|nr:recombinase family protein [Bacteroidales bacterium]